MNMQTPWLIPIEELDLANGLFPADIDGEWVAFEWDDFDHPPARSCRIEGGMTYVCKSGIRGSVTVLANTVRITFGSSDEACEFRLTVSADGRSMEGLSATPDEFDDPPGDDDEDEPVGMPVTFVRAGSVDQFLADRARMRAEAVEQFEREYLGQAA